MKKQKLLSLFLILSLVFCGCTNQKSTESDTDSNSTKNNSTAETDFAQSPSDMFSNRDYASNYDENTGVLIQLNGDSATCSSDSVKISGSTITITEEATYILSGTLEDGMIVVDTKDTAKLQLVFNGVSINSETSAPLYILAADKVFVTLASDTTNTLSNGGTFTSIDDNNIDAAIFSKQDITFNGSGSLTVTSPGGHGIVGKDDLVFTGGNYTITSASHGLDANDSIRITDTAITIDAGKDGLHAENSEDTSLGFIYVAGGTLNISAAGDGISAGAYMQIEDGAFSVVSGGGSSNAVRQTSDSLDGFPGEKRMEEDTASSDSEESPSTKAFKSTGSMLINSGSFTIDSADDSLHSNASVTVNGGTFEIASGDDGFHADETLTITAGTINISECYEGLEALDIAVDGGDITLTASDDGLNAAGGTDSSGFGGTRGNDTFGDGRGKGSTDIKQTPDDMGHAPGNMEKSPNDMGGRPGGSSSSNGSITISNGNLNITASGDGIDANGSVTISGGYTTVCGPTQGDTATLDYDTTAEITGGTFIGTGASGMAQTFSDSKQGLISVNAGNNDAQTTITLTDSAGNVVLTHTPKLSYSVVILSSPDIVSGETYTLSIGSESGKFVAN